MSAATDKANQKSDFEILFKDTPDYFAVRNAKMLNEGPMVRFICFDENDKFKANEWYPIANIHRIKSYAQ